MNNRILFNLCCDLYCGQVPETATREYLEQIFPEQSLFFLLSGEKYLHPTELEPLSAETVWETVKNDPAGIFCRHLEKTDSGGETDYLLCTANLGRDRNGTEIAAGIIYSERWGRTDQYAGDFLNRVARIKRYYEEFIASRAVELFVTEESLFRYMIDAEEKEIIADRMPRNDFAGETDSSREKAFTTDMVRSIIAAGSGPENPIVMDKRIKNFNMSNFQLQGHDYTLISFKLVGHALNDSSEYDRVIRNFSHDMRNKLSAIQTAASQLTVQKGKTLDDDDMTLAGIIQAAGEKAIQMVDRLHQLGCIDSGQSTCLDLNRIVAGIIEKRSERPGLAGKINWAPGGETRIMGEARQIETALNELLDNAIEAAGSKGNIDISLDHRDDAISLTISNDQARTQAGPTINRMQMDGRQFTPARPGRMGMGLTLARRIIANHGGELEIAPSDNDQFSVTLTFPAAIRRETIAAY
ncbi:MAG: HAMP domain-containing sensor histidine kinase [candidate division Zixibacteria bacterium]|nr:HAMP domain-containing sensor histidine kinase [candidate division Zixibacteria bacterium]